MPPKKQRNQTVTPIPRLRTRKRKCESSKDIGSTRKKQKILNKSHNEIDTFCWICHKSVQSRQFKECGKCPRVYHYECITKLEEFGTKCPECRVESVDGAELSELLSSETFLRKLLNLCVSRVFVKTREDLFNTWPVSLGKKKLFKVIDSEILRDKINHPPYYKKTARFYSDVKVMYHNCAILFKDKSRLTNAAKLVEDFKQELLDIEACPQCYYNMYRQDSVLYNPFVTLCEPPHEIIWAHLKGWSYWPAKCLKVVNNDNGKDGSKIARVRFFGKHEKSNIPLENCYCISKSHPNYPNSKNSAVFSSGPKRPLYRESIKELLEYIDLYTQKYGDFTFAEHRTPFRPMNARFVRDIQTKVVETTIAGNASFVLRNGALMKLKGNKFKSANTGGSVMSQSSVKEFSENCEPNLKECDQRHTIESTNKPDEVARSITNDIGKQLSDNASVTMIFEEEPSTDDSIDLVNQTPVMVSVGSLLENYSVPSTSAILPGNEFTLNFNSITSDDGCTRILNPIAEVAHAIELIESHSSGNRLNLFASLEQNSKYGENPQESASGQTSVTSPQATDVSNTENIVSEDDAGVESVISDDDDVVIIEPPTTESDPVVTEQQTKHFNPTLVLQHILQDKAELQKMFQLGKYATEAMFVRLWANSSKIPTAPEKITAALEKWQRAKDENITLLHEKNTISEKLKNSTEENRRNLIEINRLKSQLGDEQQKRSELECRTKEVQSNAKLIIDSLKEKVEQTKASYEEKISSQLLECEEKQLEQAQEEFNNLKMEKQRIEEALTQIQQEHFACADSKYDPEKILMFKLSDHCQVCYSPASIHCCVHHNYCSISHKNEDYEAHQKVCVNPRKRRTKLEVKSTTVRSITQENLDESQEISGVREKTTFKQEKSSFIHRRTLWSTLPSLADKALPESSHSLKKRRKNRSQKKN